MQVAVIEYARHVSRLIDAHSTEFRRDTPHPVIGLVTEWVESDGKVEHRTEGVDLGGTMRLGGQQCLLQEGSLAARIYGAGRITERHRHRYEFNNSYRDILACAGMALSGTSLDGGLVEVIELPDHPWFFACQFHPEFTSTPRVGHPLFSSVVSAARAHAEGRLSQVAHA
jgi:CTP synthase